MHRNRAVSAKMRSWHRRGGRTLHAESTPAIGYHGCQGLARKYHVSSAQRMPKASMRILHLLLSLRTHTARTTLYACIHWAFSACGDACSTAMLLAQGSLFHSFHSLPTRISRHPLFTSRLFARCIPSAHCSLLVGYWA